MIVGSGIDFIENGRVERELERDSWAQEQGIFTSSEIRFCGNKKQSALLYATCFAAKEATLKALGIEGPNLFCFRDVELLPNSEGKPHIILHARAQQLAEELGVRRLSVAVTTTARLSCAMVVLET